jgi:nitric oxide synthase-interacting protein
VRLRADQRVCIVVQSFWAPQSTLNSDLKLDKPSMDVLCPVSGKKLQLKDLVDVHFTAAPDDSGGVYMDPVTNDVFTNSSCLVVLRPTGDVLLAKTYKTCIKPDGEYKGALSCLCLLQQACELAAR